MTICIAGMHRSGTSMITRLLNLCGLYLGAENELSPAAMDNEAGFWENWHFVSLNEDILAHFGGGWDLPPAMPEGWETHDEMLPFRQTATELIRRFTPHTLWGWKDPRNSILLPFWKRLIPDLKILVCIRNPLEVVQSLSKRAYSSYHFSMNLWRTYYQRLLSDTLPTERVVTHYDSYFHSPQAELRRVLKSLNIPVSSKIIDQACATISEQLRHSTITNQGLSESKIPSDVLDIYLMLCDEARRSWNTNAIVKTLKTLARFK